MIKKITLLFSLNILSIFAFAQTLFSEDFSSGISGIWTNVDNSGNNITWRYTTTGAISTGLIVSSQLNPAGTTAANGYAIIDSDSAGPGSSEDAILTSPAINCTGHLVVYLSFNEYFAQFGASTADVEVSNDNILWTNVHMAHAGLNQDEGTPNPNFVDVDISSVAANQATVYVRFRYQGAFDYWWFIDDIQIYEPMAIDLSAFTIENLNSEYTKIPVSQATALMLSARVKNNGSNATTGGTALFEVVDSVSMTSVFSELIPLPSISAGGTQSVVPSTSFSPAAAGIYYARLTVSIAGDGNPANDTIISGTTFISDSVYQRDNDTYAGVQGIGAGAGEDGIAGQNFRINASGNLTSISFFLKDTFSFSASGTPLYFTVHSQLNDTVGPDSTFVLAVSDTLMLFPGTIPQGGAFYTLLLQGGALHVQPGLYFIAFHEVDAILPMGVSSAIYSPGAVWVHWNSIPSPPAVNGWAKAEDFGFHLAYMIRANFGVLSDGLNETASSPNTLIYPNPSSGIVTIRFAQSNDISKIEVMDAVGKRVYEGAIAGRGEENLNLSKLQSGIYSVHVYGVNYSSVQKIIISGK